MVDEYRIHYRRLGTEEDKQQWKQDGVEETGFATTENFSESQTSGLVYQLNRENTGKFTYWYEEN